MTVIEIFKQLANTSSTKDKQAILEANKDNLLLKMLLEANLNPYKLYQFNKIPDFSNDLTWVHGRPPYQDFLELLKKLETRTITGHAARDEVIALFRQLSKEETDLYSKILLKGPISIGTSTVNKVWPKLIPEFDVMLAPSKLPNLTTLQYPLYVQPKYDGFRAIYKDGKFYTRSGLVYTNTNLDTYFDCLKGINNYVLDGELYNHGQPFNDLSKALNAETVALPSGLKYHVYDCLPIKDWVAQKTKLGYIDRLKLIRGIVNDTVANYKKVIDTPTDEANSASEVMDIYKKTLKKGYEGCMIRAIEGKYQWKRVTLKSGELIKLKPFETLDLKVTGVFGGEGKFSNTIGGILLDFNGVEVRCGSGFDDAMRDEVFKDSSKYIGKTAEIKYMEITDDLSLRHPIFIRWRDDK